MAKDANVKKLIMTHLPNVEVNQDATKSAAAKNYKGEILFAKNLMKIENSKYYGFRKAISV